MRIDALDLDKATREICSAARGGGYAVHLCNAYTLSLARRGRYDRQLLNRGDLNLATVHQLLLGRRLGRFGRSDVRPRGLHVFLDVVDQGRPFGLRHYLYGSSPEVVDRLGRDFARTRR